MGSLAILLKNTASIMFAGYFGMGMNFVLTVFLARYLGAEGFGIFVTAMTFAFFGSIITDFGIQVVIVRNVARNKSDLLQYYINGLILTLSTALLSWIGIAAAVHFLTYSPYLKTVILLATSTLLFGALSKVSGSTLNALERMELLSIVTVIFTTCYSLIGVLIVVLGYGITVLIVWGIIIQVVEGVTLFLIIKKITRLVVSWKVQPYFCFSILKQSAPIGIMRFLNVINDKVDILMLSAMIGSPSVGFYAAAVKIVNFFLVVSGSLNNAILPHISAKLSLSKNNVKRIYDEVVRVLILLSFPIAIILTTNAESVVNIFFGESFVDYGSAKALKILIWSFFFNVISGPAGIVVLNFEHRLIKFVWVVGALALLNVTLNIFMIPAYGIIGASISTFICSFMKCVVIISVVFKILGPEVGISKFLIKPSICGALLFVVILIFKGENMLIGIAIGTVVYFSSLFLLKGITSEDLKIIRKSVGPGALKMFSLDKGSIG